MVAGPGSGGSRTKRILLRPVAVFAVVFEVFGTMIVFLVIIGLAALGLWCLAIFAAPVPAVVDIALYVVLLYGIMAHRDAFEPLSPPS